MQAVLNEHRRDREMIRDRILIAALGIGLCTAQGVASAWIFTVPV